ncbi:MAG: hypothetical protein VX546_08375 [Myxococcota bacterium]|nr:hypothetical protein [Myxococcota bacterium]
MATRNDPETEVESSQGWARIAERGSLLGLRITVWCYRTFGRRLFLCLIHAIVTYFFLTDRTGRKASRDYLARVWRNPKGRQALGTPPGLWQSFLHYRQFALVIVDRLAIWSGRTEAFEFQADGIELVDRLAAEGRGALVLGAHLGNFDAMRLLAERTETTVNVLMFTAHAQRINRIFQELSPDAAARVIAVEPGSIHSVFEIRACLERGEIVAILGDRVEPGDRGRTTPVSLLGDPIELPHAPFLLAHLLGYPVLLMLALRAGTNRYRVHTEQLAERVSLPRDGRAEVLSELLTRYAGRLEHYCLEHPYQWFNFFDYWGDGPSS